MQPALSSNLTLAPGSYLPSGSTLRFAGSSVPLRDLDANGKQGRIWAVAPMLPAGTESWSLRLAGGADLASADTRALLPSMQLAGGGQVRLADLHYQQDLSEDGWANRPFSASSEPGRATWTSCPAATPPDLVLRHLHGRHAVRPRAGSRWQPRPQCPGAGRLNLKRASDPDQSWRMAASPSWARVGPLRTAGDGRSVRRLVPGAGRQRLYRRAGQYACRHRGIASGPELSDKRGSGWMSGGYTGTWLWRQGGEDLGQRTAWWINFGTCADRVLFFHSPAGRHDRRLHRHWRAGRRQCGCRGGRRCGDPESPAAHPPSVSPRRPGAGGGKRDGSRRTAPASRRAGRPQPEGERRVESRGDVQLRCRRRRQWRGHERHERRADEPARRSGRVCT